VREEAAQALVANHEAIVGFAMRGLGRNRLRRRGRRSTSVLGCAGLPMRCSRGWRMRGPSQRNWMRRLWQ